MFLEQSCGRRWQALFETFWSRVCVFPSSGIKDPGKKKPRNSSSRLLKSWAPRITSFFPLLTLFVSICMDSPRRFLVDFSRRDREKCISLTRNGKSTNELKLFLISLLAAFLVLKFLHLGHDSVLWKALSFGDSKFFHFFTSFFELLTSRSYLDHLAPF